MQQNNQQKKIRQILLLAPPAVLGFLSIALWSLGVLGADKTPVPKIRQITGLNTTLPDARIPSLEGWTKLNYYQQAAADSEKYRRALDQDSYFKNSFENIDDSTAARNDAVSGYDPYPGNLLTTPDPEVENINRKLAELNKALDQTALTTVKPGSPRLSDSQVDELVNDQDMDRLDKLFHLPQQNNEGGNPDMQELSRIMDKIIAVQHPEILQDSIRQLSEKNKEAAYPVILKRKDHISLLENNASFSGKEDSVWPLPLENRFYGLEERNAAVITQTAIRASVPETQSLVNGSILKLQLSDDIYSAGILIPKGSFIYGVVRLHGDRLLVNISGIRQTNHVLAVSLSGYDLDGMAGLFVPGAITRKVGKESGSQAVQRIGLTSPDPSLKAQAASAGIEAARSLIGKKIKLVKVTVKAGYRLLLKNNKIQP